MKVLIKPTHDGVTISQVVVNVSAIFHVFMRESIQAQRSMADVCRDEKIIDGKLVRDPVCIFLIEREHATGRILIGSDNVVHVPEKQTEVK